MRSNNSNGSRAFWGLGIGALWAVLIVAAAGGGASAAPTETVLYSFCSLHFCSDGFGPKAGLIADSSGNLYGTTTNGGGASNAGVVFKLSPGGTETVLYSFCSLPDCDDGNGPVSGLIANSSGILFGTTEIGGAVHSQNGNGTVFQLSPDGNNGVVYSFGGSDGVAPQAGLIADSSGNLYGTTYEGGDLGCNGGFGCGVVFKLSPDGAEIVLHSFTGTDGRNPEAGLMADSSGNLYGTTVQGGASEAGVVFKLSPSGTETVLYSFCSSPDCSDGRSPSAGLIADSSGNLYGTTTIGGASTGCGTPARCGVVFKLSPPAIANGAWTETVLHSFTGGSDGYNPRAGLIADSSGNLYGTTIAGGAAGGGVVFKLTPGGTETVLYSFTDGSDGGFPYAGLIADSSGNLYGTTGLGGSGAGVVFKLTGTGFATPPAYVANTGSNTVSVLATATNTVAATVTVGIKPEAVAVAPDGQHAYVANTGSKSISVIDAATNTVAATIPVGVKPRG